MEDALEPVEFDQLKNLVGKYSPFFAEIRRRIVVTFAVFLTSSIAGFVFYEKLIKFLLDALSLKGVNIVFTSPFQFINLAFSCGITIGLLFTFPLIIYQILSFIKPALKIREFRMVLGFLPFSILLFAVGFIFGTLIMKWQIQIFLERSTALGIGNVLDISHFLSVVLLTSTFLGVGFQFPIVILMLLRIGLIKPKQLSKKRMWVYLGSFVFAMLLPPDSILADVLLTLPLIILFELTLALNWILEKNRRQR